MSSVLRPLPKVIALAVLTVITGCNDSSAPIGFDASTTGPASSRPTTIAAPLTSAPGATSAPGPTTVPGTAAAPAGEWVDVTANLVGLDSECGNLALVSARPDRDALIVGVADQGLWVSEAGATEWTPIGRAEGSALIDNRATSIVYDPADPNRFWQSGTYGTAVFETTDDGASFEARGGARPSDSVSIDFSDPGRQTLLSGTHESRSVYRSQDGGRTWVDISAGLPADIGFASFPLAIDASTYLVGTKSGGSSGVFRTTDGGRTWAQVYDGGVSGLPLVSSGDGRISWLLYDGGGMITSDDGGATWAQLTSWGPVGGDAGSLSELPDGQLATLGPSNVVVSDDRGATWRAIGPSLPYEPTGLTYAPFQHAFYVWRLYCDLTRDRNPVIAESIMRLDVEV
jgi:photosystem II stability/assembly factor-like uncharacterized protein